MTRVGGGGALLLLAIIVGLAVRGKRKHKPADFETQPSAHSSKRMSPIDINTESDFGEFIIPYTELTLKKKIGEGSFSQLRILL